MRSRQPEKRGQQTLAVPALRSRVRCNALVASSCLPPRTKRRPNATAGFCLVASSCGFSAAASARGGDDRWRAGGGAWARRRASSRSRERRRDWCTGCAAGHPSCHARSRSPSGRLDGAVLRRQCQPASCENFLGASMSGSAPSAPALAFAIAPSSVAISCGAGSRAAASDPRRLSGPCNSPRRRAPRRTAECD